MHSCLYKEISVAKKFSIKSSNQKNLNQRFPVTSGGHVVKVVGFGALHDLVEDDAHGVDVSLRGSPPGQRVHPQQLGGRPQLTCNGNGLAMFTMVKLGL